MGFHDPLRVRATGCSGRHGRGTAMLPLCVALAVAAGRLHAAATPPAAQVAAGGKSAGLQAARPPRPGPPRWNENYRFLSDPARRTDFWDRLRYLPMGGSSWLQLGGEYRLRFDDYRNPAFDLKGFDKDAYLLKRALFHADLHLFDDHMRVYAELGNTQTAGKKEPASATEAAGTEIQQAFVDLNLRSGEGAFTLRAGRQELGLGSQRLVTYRDGPNVRLSFDGLRMIYRAPAWSMSVFAVHPVQYALGNFNDKGAPGQLLYGAYATLPAMKSPGGASLSQVDVYLLGLKRDQTTVDGASGRLHRYTAGTRLYGRAQAWHWDSDLMYQFGRVGPSTIRAYAVSGLAGYMLPARWTPDLGVRFDLASGDRRRGDHVAGTFDPMYPKQGVYSDGSFTMLANLRAVGPTFGFKPVRNVSVYLEALKAWRASTHDAAYTPNLVPIPGTQDVSGSGLGNIYKVQATWWPNANVTLFLEYLYYDVDGAVRQAGGRNARYLELRASYRF